MINAGIVESQDIGEVLAHKGDDKEIEGINR